MPAWTRHRFPRRTGLVLLDIPRVRPVAELLREEMRRVRHGGHGPPVLLLHGMPQTHVMWHALAPRLAQDSEGVDVEFLPFHLV